MLNISSMFPPKKNVSCSLSSSWSRSQSKPSMRLGEKKNREKPKSKQQIEYLVTLGLKGATRITSYIISTNKLPWYFRYTFVVYWDVVSVAMDDSFLGESTEALLPTSLVQLRCVQHLTSRCTDDWRNDEKMSQRNMICLQCVQCQLEIEIISVAYQESLFSSPWL